jgi:hypothetical protein
LPGPKLAAPRLDALSPGDRAAVIAIYHQLGGILRQPVLRPGGSDFVAATPDGTVAAIELDEELHFNRYRELTLKANWYRDVSWANEYTARCRSAEPRCLRDGTWGRRWTTARSEALFGPAGPPGQLDGLGAPRWKQRAIYDAMKDLAALSAGPPLARLSIFDCLGGPKLEAVLDGSASVTPAILQQHVAERLIGPAT